MSSHYLSPPLRRALERAIRQARDVAEDGARDAIRRLGVADAKPPTYLGDREKELRRRLRAHGRALGDHFDKASDKQETRNLVEATAYAHWHRMLFARFLGERNLLRHPSLNAPITIEECRELAADEGLQDAWAVVERYAAAMLPAVFRLDEPVLLVDLDPAHTQKLTAIVTGLDADTFLAEDSLGWTYQFWRAAEKEAVNASGVKIGADELPAVTQLFTEPYMVRFLLHNTLGAWWAGRRLAADPELAETAASEDELRAECSLPGYKFDMLRFVRETDAGPWRPAAGTFPGWPTEVKEITMLDPCCGSGHFLTEALAILTALRRQEESLSPAASVAAVLRDNLHGLEIDGRCVQIAAFAVALSAWRIGGWQALPLPHIAWVGAPPPLPRSDFVTLADGDPEVQRVLAALHDLFIQAPILGSLLQPTAGDLADPIRIAGVERLLEIALTSARTVEPEWQEGIISARGMADAISLLCRTYVLLATNVPFLGRGKQIEELAGFIDRRFPEAKADLAVVMIDRMSHLALPQGTIAVVSPQNWYSVNSYKAWRARYLMQNTFHVVCDLGPSAFKDMNWWAARTSLTVMSVATPHPLTKMLAVSAGDHKETDEKQELIRQHRPTLIGQSGQLRNPDHRIVTEQLQHTSLLSAFATPYQGITSGDNERFKRMWWEPHLQNTSWRFLHSTDDTGEPFGGRLFSIYWDRDGSHIARPQGAAAWNKRGVAVNQMGSLGATRYYGDLFDMNTSALIPLREADLPAIWTFCSSPEYAKEIRRVDQSVKVTTATLVKVPFDRSRWATQAAADFPAGLPDPFTSDAVQWIFHGHPGEANAGQALHVVLARLCGHRWPAETDKAIKLSEEARKLVARVEKLSATDNDIVLCLPSVGGQRSLVERLRSRLAAAFAANWSDTTERRLVAEADQALEKQLPKDASLDSWLRDRAFRQHCILFHQRPFLWHIWDGLQDGFSVFVDYHRFDQAALRKLTYTALGDWLSRAKAEKKDLRYEKARELQQKLEKILEGEAPYDIFVRWKALAEQPLGWEPDLNDGVRLNIRPFVEAGVLRDAPKIKWTKDRGSDVPSAPWYDLGPKYGGKPGDRINDHHTTLAEKRAAREAAKKAAGGKS